MASIDPCSKDFFVLTQQAISKFFLPRFQNESGYKTFHMKIILSLMFIFMQINFIGIVSYQDSFSNRGKRQLRNGLFSRKYCNGNKLH